MFLPTSQRENQRIPDYIATFRLDIVRCEYISPCDCGVSVADRFLRAQFIRGIRDIREQLLWSDLSIFDDLAKKAIALEISRIDNRELPKNSNIIITRIGKSTKS